MKPDTASLWKEFNQRLFAFIRGKVSAVADAEDLLQEVFIKVHSKLGSLRSEDRLESWLYTIARNAVTDYHRRKGQVTVDDLKEGPGEQPEKENLLECMMPFVDKLPDKYRDAVKYCDLGGHTQQQLADKEKISLPGAKSRLQRGRTMLKELFTECCFIETDRYGNVVEQIPKGDCACT